MIKKKLFKNTIMLYLMNFSGYFFSLITVPYQTRVLSISHFGLLSFAVGIMNYFQLFINFGFMLSATEEVSLNRDNHKCLNEIVTSVFLVRLVLILLSFLFLLILLQIIPKFSESSNIFYIFFFATALESLLPVFFLRGMEDMQTIAMVTFLSKAFTTILMFKIIRSDSDYLFVPWLRVAGAFISLFIAYGIIGKKYQISLTRVPFFEVLKRIKKSSGYFFSRLASFFYRGCNTIVLGLISPTATLALYTSVEKIVNTGMAISSPIADSLFPYMVHTRDFKTAWKLLKTFFPFLLFGAIIGTVYAEQIVVCIFGSRYAQSSNVLRALMPLIVVALPNYIIAFPVLVPMGLGKLSNYANLIGAGFHIVGLFILYFRGHISIISVAVLASITESIILLFRIGLIIKYRSLLNTVPSGMELY